MLFLALLTAKRAVCARAREPPKKCVPAAVEVTWKCYCAPRLNKYNAANVSNDMILAPLVGSDSDFDSDFDEQELMADFHAARARLEEAVSVSKGEGDAGTHDSTDTSGPMPPSDVVANSAPLHKVSSAIRVSPSL